MKLGIVGFEGSGKSTLYAALTATIPGIPVPGRTNVGTFAVCDERLEHMRDIYRPKKYSPARLGIHDFPPTSQVSDRARGELIDAMRGMDALLLVISAHDGTVDKAGVVSKATELLAEYTLYDLQTIERRIEKLESQSKRGIKLSGLENAELELMKRCQVHLENEEPLGDVCRSPSDPDTMNRLRLFSSKPKVLIVNVGEDHSIEAIDNIPGISSTSILNARIEVEIAAMENSEDQREFMDAYGLEEAVAGKLSRLAFEASGLICFFTVGPDEVRAWPTPENSTAVESAGKIHSDLARGFIRAEVTPYESVKDAKSPEDFKRMAKTGVEGKEHVIHDADILNIRFNV